MAIDWSSDASLNLQGLAMHKVDLILFGIMLWECTVNLWFDWEVISRKRPFKWPIAIYWLTKWSTLVFILTVNITNFQVTPVAVNCQATGDFIDLAARVGMAGASGLLMLRCFALWERKREIVIPISLLFLGQCGLYLHNVFIVKERWSGAPDMTCQIYTVTWPFMKMQFIYTMVTDGVILFLSLYALLRMPGRTNLWNLLFLDGLSYFVVAFASYLACTILAYLDISLVLSFMFSDTATILATTAACRSFQRIATYDFNKDSSGAIPPSTRIQFWKSRPWRSDGTPASASTSPSVIEEGHVRVHTVTSFRAADTATPPKVSVLLHSDSASEVEKQPNL